MAYQKELSVVFDAVNQAAKAILEMYHQDDFFVRTKTDHTPVTAADMRSNEILEQTIKPAFPNYAWLSEESVDDLSRLESEHVWLVDPLDGTRDFIARNGDFAISVALVQADRPVLGVVYAPDKDKLYYALKGQGAFLRNQGNTQRLQASESLDQLKLVRSRSRRAPELIPIMQNAKVATVEDMGSATLKACAIAEGYAELYYAFETTSAWDSAAVDLIVHEAGGVFFDLKKDIIKYNRPDTINRGFIALNRIENYWL